MSDERNPRMPDDDALAGPADDNLAGPDDALEDNTLVDMAAVRRDDELLDALGTDGLVPTNSEVDYQLATLLASWRDDVLAGAMPATPTVDDVETAIAAEATRTKNRKRMRHMRIAAASVAIGAVLLGGVTALARQAQPGDALWDVRDLMFGEQTTTASVYSALRADLVRAERALDDGNTGAAIAYIQEAKNGLPRVGDAGQRNELEAWINRLNERIRKGANGSANMSASDPTSQSADQTDGTSESSTKPTTPITTTPPANSPSAPSQPGQQPSTTDERPSDSIMLAPDKQKQKASETPPPSTTG